jgi:RimJ/RimL family protein N-acetyltransferase
VPLGETGAVRFPEDVPTLTDGVVTLRAHTDADVPRILDQARDPESARWTTVPSPYAESDAWDFVGVMVPGGWADATTYGFAIEHEGRFVGSVDLRDRGGGEGELGYALHPEARGQGLMRRAVDLVLDWGFARGMEVVHWRAFVGNWASRRTVWSLGFTFGPTIPRLLPHREERRDAWTAWIAAGDPREPTVRWLEPPVLAAGAARLRPWRESDGPRLVEISRDPVVRRWIPESPLPRSLDAVPDYLTRVRDLAARDARLAWCVADAATDEAVGGVALFEMEDEPDDVTAQVGYWAHPAGRGTGAMAAALGAVVDWAFTPAADHGLGGRRLYLLTSVGNVASRRLAERAGFTHVGTERASAGSSRGGFTDAALYDLLRDDLVRTGAGGAPSAP